MQKVVYIAGNGHSGSTILDMCLGAHPGIIGLGEIANILLASSHKLEENNFTKIKCSCGNDMCNCDFWMGVREWLRDNPCGDINDKWKFLLTFFQKKYGKEKVLIDSSKTKHEYLLFLNDYCDLYVIFLVRDYRSWVYSRFSRHGHNIFMLMLHWYINNIRIYNFLKKNNLNVLVVGYEELALYPKFILEKITKFIGLSFNNNMLQPNKTKSHIIRGNVARGDSEKRKNLMYDARWLASMKINFLAPVFFPIIRWNRDYVYSNVVRGMTNAFGVSQQDFLVFGDLNKEKLVQELGEYDELLRNKRMKKSQYDNKKNNRCNT